MSNFKLCETRNHVAMFFIVEHGPITYSNKSQGSEPLFALSQMFQLSSCNHNNGIPMISVDLGDLKIYPPSQVKLTIVHIVCSI